MESPAIASAQTNSQRRFTVVPLPVFPIVAESLLPPFRCLPELVKFGRMPLVLMLAIDVFCYGLEREDVSKGLTNGLFTIVQLILFTPFVVAWTKIAIRCRASVANHPAFSYSRTQWMYLLAFAVMFAVAMVLVGIPFALLRYGHRNFDQQSTLLGGVGFVIGLGLFLIGYIRLAFVFPAIAIGRYSGVGIAWKQTAGNIERLAAILLLSYLPYWIIRLEFEWYMGYHPPGIVEATRGIVDVLLGSFGTTALAGPALAYKALMPAATQSADRIAANAGGR